MWTTINLAKVLTPYVAITRCSWVHSCIRYRSVNGTPPHTDIYRTRSHRFHAAGSKRRSVVSICAQCKKYRIQRRYGSRTTLLCCVISFSTWAEKNAFFEVPCGAPLEVERRRDKLSVALKKRLRSHVNKEARGANLRFQSK